VGNKKTKIKFVDVKKYGFVAEPRYYFWGWSNSPKILARSSALRALIKAKRFFPKGYNFKIWDVKRTYNVQAEMVKSFRRRLKLLHPELSKSKLKKLVFKFSGGLGKSVKRLDSHRKGGSFDLTIINKKGAELYMATDHDDLTRRASTDFFEKKKSLTLLEKEAKKNRRLLKRVMKKAGFVNYDAEWWHWSYDK
jgi:D-alanyl-D-alanine dipeptidase